MACRKILNPSCHSILSQYFSDLGENQWKLFGVTSWGSRCGERGHPGVYVKVSAYITWIQDVLNSTDSTNENHCEAPNPPPNAYFTGDTYPPYQNGRQIQFSCNECYSGNGRLLCTAGSWQVMGTCITMSRSCPNPGNIRNSRRNPVTSSWPCGSSISYTCNGRSQSTGPTSSTCGEDQQWNPPISSITCKMTCSDPGSVSFATRSPGYQTTFNELDTVRYTCMRCWRGSKTITCVAGIWIGRPVVCSRMTCSRVQARSNLRYTFSGNPSCGAIIQDFSCRPGFQMYGNDRIECIQVNNYTARWSSSLPICHPTRTNTSQLTTTTPRLTAPTPSSEATALLVLIDGRHGPGHGRYTESTNTVDFYNLSPGSIAYSHQGAPSPYRWTRPGGAVDNGNIYVLGGYGYKPGGLFLQYGVAKYSVHDNRWEVLPNTTWSTYNSAPVFVHQGTLYAADGDAELDTRHVWKLDISNTNGLTTGWTQEDIDVPYSVLGGNAVTMIGDRVFIIGRSGGVVKSRTNMSWRPGTGDSWVSHSDIGVARWGSSLCAVSDGASRIWVLGGCPMIPGFVEMYRVSTDQWTKIDALPDIPFRTQNTFASRFNYIQTEVCGYHNGYIYAVFQQWKKETGHVVDWRFHIFNTMDLSWSVSDTEVRRESSGPTAYQPLSVVVPNI